MPLTPELAAVVGENELPRNQVSKKVWEYIKANKLQDKDDGRVINPDETLAKVFGSSEPINMFKLAGVLSPHIGEKKD